MSGAQTRRRPKQTLVYKTLVGAKALISPYKAWTCGDEALTKGGKEVKPRDARAVQFCAYGALKRAAFDLTGDCDRAGILAYQIAQEFWGQPAVLINRNDAGHRLARIRHRDILAEFDEAIAQAGT